MAKKVRIGGVVYNVPDNATLEQIQEYLATKGVTAATSSARPPADPAILAAQRSRYPSAQELGDPRGRAQTSFLEALVNTEPGAQTMMGPEAAFLGAGGPGTNFARVPSAIETMASPQGRVLSSAGQQLREAPIVPIVQGAANLLRTPIRSAKDAISDRMLYSLVGPDKKVFDFGADPIEQARTLGPRTTLPAMQRANAKNMERSSELLDAAAADRTAVARQIGADDGVDVQPFLQGQLNRQIKQARDNNLDSLADDLQGFLDKQFDRIKREYGSTHLTPQQILAEKRVLSKETKF